MRGYFRKSVFIVLTIVFIISCWWIYAGKEQGSSVGSGNTIEVTDSIGRKVYIPARPKRVVVLNPSNLEVFCSVGGKVVGKPTTDSLPAELQEKLKGVEAVGIIHSPNLEKIISLQPDLVIGTNVPFHVTAAASLQSANIPVYINSINSYEDVLKTVDFYGRLVGEQERAKKVREQIELEYKTAVQKTHQQNSPRSLIIFGTTDSFSMATKKSFSGDLLERIGGSNIANLNKDYLDAYVPLSMEYITQKDPEVIMIITMGNAEQVIQHFRKNMQENPIWQEVSAVKNNRIHQLPAQLFTVNPGTQVAKALNIISDYVYPKERK